MGISHCKGKRCALAGDSLVEILQWKTEENRENLMLPGHARMPLLNGRQSRREQRKSRVLCCLESKP